MKQLTFGELLKFLEQQPEPEVFRRFGFSNPHSYRGYYGQLAFVPCTDVPISEMLKNAAYALDTYFTGYKGGSFLMSTDVPVWIAEMGRCSPTDLKITEGLLITLFQTESLI